MATRLKMETLLRTRTGISMADGELLERLSSIHAGLRRYEQTRAALEAQLRQQRVYAAERKAVLRADERRLAALRTDEIVDRVDVRILEASVQEASLVHATALFRSARTGEASAPLLDHAEERLLALERQVTEAREGLSSLALKAYEVLLHAKRLPFVARLRDGMCDECNMKLPSGIASLALTSDVLTLCPHCCRVLLREPEPPSSSR
jgi:predicted  nucleic acid-binding Zn-ribbon protein